MLMIYYYHWDFSCIQSNCGLSCMNQFSITEARHGIMIFILPIKFTSVRVSAMYFRNIVISFCYSVNMMEDWFILQKKGLLSLYEDKVKHLVKKLLTLDGSSERSVRSGWFLFFFIVYSFISIGNISFGYTVLENLHFLLDLLDMEECCPYFIG